jgi:UDP-3-O-acyl N-acetylglucosamine deacetylase
VKYARRPQYTLAAPVRLAGFGYWSGRDVHVEFRPAAPNTGIVFVRQDLAARPRIPARVDLRVETPRRTTLAAAGATVEMVEHVLASLAGLHIDNCEVWVDGAELPGLDGSSRPFVDALTTTSRVAQAVLRECLVVTRPLRVGDAQCWVEAHPDPRGALTLQYRLDYGPTGPIGRQQIDVCLSPHTFCTELAPARTFLLHEEALWLRQRGLGTRVSCSDLLVFDADGVVGNTLRFDNECVRHKTLDLVGDLALAGCDLRGRIVACRSGHRLNAALVRELLAQDQQLDACRDVA